MNLGLEITLDTVGYMVALAVAIRITMYYDEKQSNRLKQKNCMIVELNKDMCIYFTTIAGDIHTEARGDLDELLKMITYSMLANENCKVVIMQAVLKFLSERFSERPEMVEKLKDLMEFTRTRKF